MESGSAEVSPEPYKGQNSTIEFSFDENENEEDFHRLMQMQAAGQQHLNIHQTSVHAKRRLDEGSSLSAVEVGSIESDF